MLRTLILVSIALISAGFTSQPALAEEVKHQTKDAVEGKCNEKDGTFWATPDGATYGCGYKDGGGIICDKGGGNIGPWFEEEKRAGRDESDFPWELAGLLGLIGLAGLASRPPRRDYPSEVTADR